VPIREIRGFDEAKVRVGEGADADTRGKIKCSQAFWKREIVGAL